MPSVSSNGETCSLTQYNLLERKTKPTSHCRKEIFKQMKTHLSQNQDINDLIIAGDFNQDIASNEVKALCREIGVKDAHSYFNDIPIDQMDKTYVRGSTHVDSIAISCGLMNHVEGIELIGQNKIVISDHRAYILDINFEDYFETNLSS